MNRKHRIGIVGAGMIVEHAHLVGYRRLGLDVAMIYDRDRERAERAAAKHPGLKAVSLDEILDDPTIDIVDIAITPHDQVSIAERCIDAGKHLLCQKPLAPDLASAKPLVARAERAGIKLAVNQQMRWEPMIAATRDYIDEGGLGDPTAASIYTNMRADFPADHWFAREPRLMGLYGAIHFLDSARYLFGEPELVTARLGKDPLQNAIGDMWINAWVEWPGGFCLSIHERYTNWAGDLEARMRVEGTRGAVRGRFGIWDRYPEPSPSVVERLNYADGNWEQVREGQTWLPDAFPWPMKSLIEAIDTGGEPMTGGRDNLKTMRLVECLYRSSAERRAVRPEEIDTL